jgi:hypothetical protein
VTTRITVTTGDGGLLDRNAQQQAAARQAALVKAQAEKATALGNEQLRKERIAQGRDPATGLPLPSFGTTSTIRRLDQQPAANRRRMPKSLVIWYPAKAPPLAIFRNITSEGQFFEGADPPRDPYSLTTFLGENALSMPYSGVPGRTNAVFWRFTIPNPVLGDGDFTIEYFARLGSSVAGGSDNGSCQIAIDLGGIDYDPLLPEPVLTLRTQRNLDIRPNPEDSISEYASDLVVTGVGQWQYFSESSLVSPSQFFHACAQRINGNFYFHFDGQPVPITFDYGGNPELLNFNFTPTYIGFFIENINIFTPTVLSQVRISSSALYGTGSFVPPTQPFYRS